MNTPQRNHNRHNRGEIDQRNRDRRQMLLLLLQIVVDVLTLKR